MTPSRRPDYHSDSEDEDEDQQRLSGTETDVLLGIPDGPIDAKDDLIDAAVSRIGGLPALLPSSEPPFASSHCKACSNPMELLVQMWCPFEDSPMDRALYVWGCARSGCQRKDGSVRAWRGLRYNAVYAAKLAKKREREEQGRKEEKQKSLMKTAMNSQPSSKTNPFSMTNSNPVPNPFASYTNPKQESAPFGMGTAGLGAHIFGAVNPQTDPSAPEDIQSVSSADRPTTPSEDNGSQDSLDDVDEGAGSGEDSLIEALASTSMTDSEWEGAPSYPPIYLSTVSEFAPLQRKEKNPKGVVVDDLDVAGKDKDKKSKDSDLSWVKETYENSMDVDQVFEKFMTRVGWEDEQCVRYELKGTPLPFATDKTFDLLWPLPPQDPIPTTKAAFKVVSAQKGTYTTSAIPRCEVCGQERVFECQLMPNLINVLRPSYENQNSGGKKKLSDEERRREVELALKGGEDKTEKRGMEWGTCIVFSCGQDCSGEGSKGVGGFWREETVFVQWDT